MAITVGADFMAGTYTVPTITVNQFVASSTAGGIRLVLGENAPGSENIHYRAAFQMTVQDAAILAELLQQFVNSSQPQTPQTPLGSVYGTGGGQNAR